MRYTGALCSGLCFFSFVFVLSCEKTEALSEYEFRSHHPSTSLLSFRFSEKLSTSVFDPHRARSPLQVQLAHALYPTLTTKDPLRLSVRPALASSWKVSALGGVESYQFFLKKAYWGDGSPLTAYDVRESLIRVVEGGFASSALLALAVKGAHEFYFSKGKEREDLRDAIGIHVLDARTIVIEAAFEKLPLLTILSHPTLSVLPFVESEDRRIVDDRVFRLDLSREKSRRGGLYDVVDINDQKIVLNRHKKLQYGKNSVANTIVFRTDMSELYSTVFSLVSSDEKVKDEEGRKRGMYSHFLLSISFPSAEDLDRRLGKNGMISPEEGEKQKPRKYVPEDESFLWDFFDTFFYDFVKTRLLNSISPRMKEFVLHTENIFTQFMVSPHTKTSIFPPEKKNYELLGRVGEEARILYKKGLSSIKKLSVFFNLPSQSDLFRMQEVWYEVFEKELRHYVEENGIRFYRVQESQKADIVVSIRSPLDESAVGMTAAFIDDFATGMIDETSFSHEHLQNVLGSWNYYLFLESLNASLQERWGQLPLLLLPFVDIRDGDEAVFKELTRLPLFWRPLNVW